jgi:plastocyanin
MAVRRAVAVWAAALVISCGLLALPLVALAATSTVNIQNFAFTPNTVTITVGDSVTWTNRDAASHGAKFSDRSTAVLSQGQSGTLQFMVAGTFPYICTVHGASMPGTIIVRAPATAPPTPAPTAPPTPAPTAPPTSAPTAPPTPAATESPTVQPTSAAPSASPSLVAGATETASASPSAVAAQVTPAPTTGGGSPAPLLIGAAALAVVVLGAIAFFLARRS